MRNNRKNTILTVRDVNILGLAEIPVLLSLGPTRRYDNL